MYVYGMVRVPPSPSLSISTSFSPPLHGIYKSVDKTSPSRAAVHLRYSNPGIH